VAEARRAAGVAVALYIVDIDGSQLIRLAGSEDFPETLEAPPALGPEIVPEGLPSFYELLKRRLPRCVATPLWLRGRVIGLLLCVGAPVAPLDDIAKQGAAALELANDYTDVIEAARRRKPTTAAAEVQYHLLPPRVARVTGAQIAGALSPAYEVGGDWFDFVENRDGSWLAIADTAGTGPTAAGLGASALGALRAARRSGQDLVQAAESIDEVVRALGNPSFVVTALLARWHAPTAMLAWLNCGHPPAYVVDRDGAFTELEGPVHAALGAGAGPPSFEVAAVSLEPGDRLVLYTDGITERFVKGGGRFGADGMQRAVQAAGATTAAATAMAIQDAVVSAATDPLQDDATLVVLAVD
jgi:serine phosphatase RsbU (regulator of sigma subunit)